MESTRITPSTLPIAVRTSEAASAVAVAEAAVGHIQGLSLVDQEKTLLVHALEKAGGNQTQAARLLRITRDTLRYKMKKFNLR